MKASWIREIYRIRDYVVAGIFVAFVDGGLFLLLVQEFGPFRSSLISGAVALIVGWSLSSRFVFRDQNSNSRSAAEYALLGGTNYLLGNGILAGLLLLHVNRMLAKLLSMLFVSLLSFLVQRWYIFAKKRP